MAEGGARRGNGRWLNVLELGVVPLLVACFIVWPTLRDPSVLPVEKNDEAVHTLVEIPLALQALRHGEIPKINLFNNFGTPLFGDPIVCPLAPHALAYLVLDPVSAYIVDKVLISVLTLIVLTLFYRHYFRTWVAPLCAALTFTAPGFLWFVHHFPHQGVVLYFVSILLAFERFRRHPSVATLALTFLCQLAFVLGVGINAMLFGLPFLVAYAVLAEKGPSVLLASFLASLAGAVGVVQAHLLAFAQISPVTARARVDFSDFSGYTLRSFTKFLLGFQDPEYRIHTDAAIFYSLPVVCLALIGLSYLFHARHPARREVFWLGLVPFLAVGMCLLFPVFREWITPLRPVDVTRVWWFSNVFFVAAFGYGVTALLRHEVPRSVAASMLLACLAVVVVALSRVRDGAIDVWLSLVLIPLVLALSLADAHRRWAVPIAVLILWSLLPRADRFVQLINPPWALSRREELEFPGAFAERMAPYTRLASTSAELDQKAGAARRLGSNGRSIILNAELKDRLARAGRIQSARGGLLYSFDPAPPDVLAEYGIRYFVAGPGDALERWGWKRLAEDSYAGRLYESPRAVHPCASRNSRGDIVSYVPISALDTTSFTIGIASRQIGHDVVCAFYAWRGWRATQQGRPLPVSKAADLFLRVTPAVAGSVRFEYAPVSDRYIVLSSATSVGGVGLWLVGFSLYRRRDVSRRALG